MLKTLLTKSKECKSLKLSFREIDDHDKDFLLEIFESSRDDLNARYLDESVTEEERMSFVKMQFDLQDVHYKKYYPEAEFLIVKRKKERIGRLYIEEWTKEIRIMDITINPKYRGQGLGGAIMSSIIRIAEEKQKLTGIHVEKKNRALNLYNRLGFEKEGGNEMYHLMKRKAVVSPKLKREQYSTLIINNQNI